MAWREEVGRVKRRAYRAEDYWAKPVPGFGDPRARPSALVQQDVAEGIVSPDAAERDYGLTPAAKSAAE